MRRKTKAPRVLRLRRNCHLCGDRLTTRDPIDAVICEKCADPRPPAKVDPLKLAGQLPLKVDGMALTVSNATWKNEQNHRRPRTPHDA